MTDHTDFSPDNSEFGDLSEAQANLLFGLGRRRPVDELIDRLSEDDGPTFFEDTLMPGLISAYGGLVERMVDRSATLDELVEIKEKAKALKVGAEGEPQRLVAMAGYFFAVGTALILHNKLICSRPRTELQPIMLDLATVTPPPLSEIIEKAANPPSYSTL